MALFFARERRHTVFPVTRTPWVTFGCFGTLIERQAGSDRTRPIADVEAMLAELRAHGCRLGVLTNCDDRQFELVHVMFHQPFDLFVTAERIRGRKPAPWHFRAFEQMVRVRRADWVHVACSWVCDIEPARALGISTVWLDRGRSAAEPPAAGVRVHSASEAICAIAERLTQSEAALAV
jgi:HAD superfamily hydrolase (TIGR01549 family)